MKTSTARAVAYFVVALLAVGALRARPPQLATAGLADDLTGTPGAPASRAPAWVQRADTLARGESLALLFARAGVPGASAMAALRETPEFDDRRIPAGLAVTMRNLDTDSLPSEIVLHFAVDRLVRLTRTASGWASVEERLPWTTDTALVAGTITSSLYAALEQAAEDALPARLRSELAWSLADIFEYRVDMSRDLRTGDEFQVAFERATTLSGAVKVGRVLAVSMRLSGDTMQAFRFGAETNAGHYYDQDGKSLRAAFLRAPLEFRRISSVFGRRKHPILGTWRSHNGTDYAASSGTPVRTVGEGTVVFAGRRGGYGNTIEVKHPNGYVTRYAHLRGFARSARRGARVSIGQTVGYVGMTGLATGPHLHFEVLVNGVQRDPRRALQSKTGVPLEPRERGAFEAQRTQLLAALNPERNGQLRLAAVD